jgi:hypothetical protein
MELAHGTHTRSDTFTGNASNTTTTSTSGSNITDGATGASCARMTLATKISHDTASRLRCRTGAVRDKKSTWFSGCDVEGRLAVELKQLLAALFLPRGASFRRTFSRNAADLRRYSAGLRGAVICSQTRPGWRAVRLHGPLAFLF